MSLKSSRQNSPFATLRKFIRERVPVERCELCSVELGADHKHLIEPSSRKMICACDGCSLLFSNTNSKYRCVPRRIQFLQDFRMTDAQWESLSIPINMAFFFYSSPAGRIVALYPSPAGPTESLLELESWEEIASENPVLKKMEPDVEALLVNRVGYAHQQCDAEYFLAPIDECYKLVGLIRTRWQGLSGGKEVWEEIERFFSGLKQRSVSPTEGLHA